MKKRYQEYNRFQSQLDLPFLETPKQSLQELFQILELKFGLTKGSNQKLVDLGSGNGQVVIFSATNYHIKSIGVEINQELIKEANERINAKRNEPFVKKKDIKRIRILNLDFYQINLSSYDFIYIYSLPTMQKYLKHVFFTIKKDAIVISYKYPLEGFEKILTLEFILEAGEKEYRINSYFYRRF